MGDSFLPELGDLIFSVLIGYAGALEFLYVIRHLYHWSCNHMEAAATQYDAEGLKRLQDRMRNDLATADGKEQQTGLPTMKDGVLYRDGFRIDPEQLELERLKAEQNTPEGREKRKKEIEAELKRQRAIEEQTRQQLAAAEAKLEQQRAAEEEAEQARKLLEAERAREAEQRRKEEERQAEEEEARKLLERERQREEEERKRDAERAEAARKAAEEEERRQKGDEEKRRKEEEAARKHAEEEAQRQREAELLKAEEKKATKEAEEQSLKLLNAERQREEEQLQQEIEEDEERKFFDGERLREAEQRNRELGEYGDESPEEGEKEEEELRRLNVNEAQVSGKHAATSEAETLNNILQLLTAESERSTNEIEYELSAGREREERQKLIEENARKFLEADHEMEELLESVQKQRQYSGTESAPQSPQSVIEEPCIRKTMSPLSDNSRNSSGSSERLTKTVKTQFGQQSNDLYSVSTKPLLFKSISDDTQSFEPHSSLSPQPSAEEYASGVDGADGGGSVHNKIDVQFTQLERQEPDGEDQDNNSASAQYTDEYLRSLDGIKQRPLVREDGSGRRRAFKKRRSSGSSNSSFDSRASRDEELKMFTSLEEEELQPKKEGDTEDYTPIKYASDQLLKVKLPRRRHKRSPAKDAKPSDSAIRGSLEMLDEEANTNPWGEVTPEHYKDMPFWKREKSISIDEEAFDVHIPAIKKEVKKDAHARIVPKSSTFEEATHTQNEEALTALQRQQIKEEQDQQETASGEAAKSDTQSNLQATHNAAPNSPNDRKSASPRLRRSPRIEEMDHYEDKWNKNIEIESEPASAGSGVTPTTPSTPSIVVARMPDTAPWRDKHGLLMEGISDFYDFTASVNPSRSRSTSRQPSPVKSQPGTPGPKNVEFVPSQESMEIVDVYDDTGSLTEAEFTKENVVAFIEGLREDCHELSQTIGAQLQNVADSPEVSVEGEEGDARRLEMNLLVQTLRIERQSRSRSRSPLPTADQLARSVKTRRNRLIEKNDKLFETLNLPAAGNQSPIESPTTESPTTKSPTIESPTILIECPPSSSTAEQNARDTLKLLVAEARTCNRSRSCSPLPTPDNLKRSLDTRRSRRIKHNDELSEKLGVEIDVSRTPSPTELPGEQEHESSLKEEEVCTRESMNQLVDSLRAERAHSGSRSRSPLPTALNLKTGLEQRRKKKIQQNDALFQQLHIDTSSVISDPAYGSKSQTAPVISIQCCDEEQEEQVSGSRQQQSEYTMESMTSLVESLRLQRSRSKSPMRRLERERTPEPSSIRVGLSVTDHLSEGEDEHERRSRTPSRSMSTSPIRARAPTSAQQSVEESEFHTLLNLEASQNRTLNKCSEEIESILAEKQRKVDAESLRKLSSASEEMELRTVTPVTAYESEDKQRLTSMTNDERLRALRSSPTTPNYERTISQEWQDVQRIKDEMLTSSFKRSTYVGESLDLGSEFEPLREQTARFRRSRSPSPSLVATETREAAMAQREIQDKILTELVTASAEVANAERLGAKPKECRSMSRDIQETQYEELRRLNAEFKRSRSQSRSPLGEVEAQEIAKIEAEAGKRELEEHMKQNLNFQEFSRYLNVNFLDNERRASDSALIQKPEVFLQLQELEEDVDIEPENYHHFRRFSLNQEQSVEEYPNDDYVFVSQIEVQTPNGTRTWIREDYYSEDFEQLSLITEESGGELTIEAVSEAAEAHLRAGEEDYTDDSADERQTVVEVEDEIDEDICDFNERGPTDESHHEISECEEAERDMDRYADREASDWQQVGNIDELLLAEDMLLAAGEGGAVGGGDVSLLAYDADSAEIDKIYDEAIKNRKPSGILRDYDTILKEMQKNYMNNNVTATTDGSEADMSGASDSDRKKSGTKEEREASLKLIKNERRVQELRYLGDASESERHATRLRTRYGYAPQLHGQGVEELDIEVDLNYKPKREYNWRKNFKIDDADESANKVENEVKETETHTAAGECDSLDLRKFSLGGESITLFSQNADGVCYVADESQLSADVIHEGKESAYDVVDTQPAAEEQIERAEKPKKKKSKKKLRKETKNNSAEYDDAKDEDDSESQLYSRRSSSIKMDTDSPKRSTKSRSRRNSRNSLTNDESSHATFSPRSSVGVVESATKITTTNDSTVAGTKKKLKKRKKTKEADIKEEPTLYTDLTVNVPTASAAVSPGTASINPLATLSPQNSICTPSSSLDSETPDLKELISAPSSAERSPVKQQECDGAHDFEVRISAISDALISSAAIETITAGASVAPPVVEVAAAAVIGAATDTPNALPTVATRSSTTPTTTTKTTVDTFDILKDANFYPLF